MQPGQRFFKAGFYILALLNLILLFLWMRPKGPHHFGPPDASMVVDRLTRSLDLNEEQQAGLKTILEEQEKEKKQMFEKTDTMRSRMADCLAGRLDCDTVMRDANDFEQMMFKYHKRILEILDPGQKAKYLRELTDGRRRGPKGPI